MSEDGVISYVRAWKATRAVDVAVTREVVIAWTRTVAEAGLTRHVQTAAIYADDWLARKLLRTLACPVTELLICGSALF